MRRRRAGKSIPGISSTDQADSDRAPPYPFMSLWMTHPVPNRDFFNPGRATFLKDVNAGTALVARHPLAMTATVQVDLWCGSDGGNLLAYNLEPQVDLRFLGDYVVLPIDWGLERWYKPPFNMLEHAKYFGRTGFRLHKSGWRDGSELEVGQGPKAVRSIWSGRAEMLLPYRAEDKRLITSIAMEVRDSLTDELYGTANASVED